MVYEDGCVCTSQLTPLNYTTTTAHDTLLLPSDAKTVDVHRLTHALLTPVCSPTNPCLARTIWLCTRRVVWGDKRGPNHSQWTTKTTIENESHSAFADEELSWHSDLLHVNTQYKRTIKHSPPNHHGEYGFYQYIYLLFARHSPKGWLPTLVIQWRRAVRVFWETPLSW